MTMIYDVMGNPTGYDDDIGFFQETQTPGIVKTTLPPNQPVPSWVVATRTLPDGTVVGYSATDTARASGYVQAAIDTIESVPASVQAQLAGAFDVGGEAFNFAKLALVVGGLYFGFRLVRG